MDPTFTDRLSKMFGSPENLAAATEKYTRTFQSMQRVAKEWLEMHPGPLSFDLSPENRDVIGAISEGVIQRVGRDERSRDLLRHVDSASGCEGTIFQLAALVEWLGEHFGAEIVTTG